MERLRDSNPRFGELIGVTEGPAKLSGVAPLLRTTSTYR